MSSQTLPEIIADSWARERPDLAASALGLTVRIRALAIMIDHELARIAERENIQTDDLLLLFALRRVGAPYCLRPTDIYGLLNVTSGAATYRIERLVKNDLAQRIGDPEDGRGYMLQISDHGMSVIDRCVEAFAESSDRALSAAGLDAVHEVALKASLHLLETGWEAVIPAEENPLARREKSLLQRGRSSKTRRR